MFLSLVLAAAAAAAPTPAAQPTPAPDATWETYACTDGPQVQLALGGGRPATAGWLQTSAGVVTLSHTKGDAVSVLRGQGYMVRASNWADILYAPPGREKDAYECRVADASAKPGAPKPE